ncbi:DMT family transporter [Enterovibrio sp. ZSDZ42]|uniref:DMT family transporter n=1 Tax=Enterovibrio gelatinilyticus TaxID=2899819 RepID=A0ABT5R3A4_9GAMM|nr:DMT family transporter [Enterovibrio sp. ZSDZ42]MDD1794751.1 DMT family transporter [Enterovibrio sp. ZSDZ42]
MEINRKDSLELVLLAALWGASFILIRYAVPEFGPFSLILVRVGLAASLLLPVLIVRRQFPVLKAHWFHACVVGLFSSAVPFLLFAYAMMSVTGSFASIVNAGTPIWGAIIAYLWLGESMTRNRVFGLLLGVVGVVILVWGKLDFGDQGLGFPVLAVLGATFMYGIAASYTKRFLHDIPPLVTATGSQIGATLSLLPFGIYFWPDAAPSGAGWIAAMVLGFASTGFAYVIFFRLIANVGPANTMTVTFLIPLFAAVWGAMFLGEVITIRMMLGALTIFLGTALATGFLSRRKTG